MLRSRRQAGDTIVEVMIVLAVLGLAIGVSYATANRSLLNARQAQENSIATELAQSQVEAIQSLGCGSANPTCDPTIASNASHQLFNQPASGFCLDTSTAPAQIKPITDPLCTTDGLYHTKITYNNATKIFTVVVSWDDVLGQGTDTVTMNYQLSDTLP